MPVSLDTVVIGTFRQILPRIGQLIVKAEDHCTATALEPADITDARLAPDMWPFAKQIFECGHHSARAIEGVRKGVFNPEIEPAPADFASLHQQIADAIAVVESVEPGELDGISAQDMKFEFGTMSMPFTVEDFLLSFTLPNFYFHATTAYAILRNQGLPLGKVDYLGKLRIKA